jgi:cell cycle arrest protein BUB3
MSDYILSAPPGDGISSVCFNPKQADSLLVSSWDSTVRLYNVRDNLPTSTHYLDGAVLTCCYNDDGYQAYCGGLDQSVYKLDIHSKTKVAVASHNGPVSSLAYNVDNSVLLSGSWDGSIFQWDSRQSRVTNIVPVPNSGKVYSISTCKNKIVVATSGRQIAIYDIRNMSCPEQLRESPLRHQTRIAKCSPDGTSFAIGSIEGRIAIEYFDMNPEVQAAKYAFKCHRRDDLAYPVNFIEYHPIYGTFASGIQGYINHSFNNHSNDVLVLVCVQHLQYLSSGCKTVHYVCYYSFESINGIFVLLD